MAYALFTIGVYGTSEESFFAALAANRVTHFVDVRRRRGLRGSQYAYANAGALMARLGQEGIEYLHLPELAPPQHARDAQLARDPAVATTTKARRALGPEFRHAYESEVLAGFDAEAFFRRLPQGARMVLFCVESDPQTCHRSVLAEHLSLSTGTGWFDITPRA